MTTFREPIHLRTEVEPHSLPPVESIRTPDGSIIQTDEFAMSGIDRVVFEGYRISARSGAMSSEQAARSYRKYNPNSVFIPEDFETL